MKNESQKIPETIQAVTIHEPQQSAALFAGKPQDVIKSASEAATALKDVVRAQGLISNIQGKEYPRCEAWTLLGSMVGVFPVLCWTRPVEGGWEARVEARTISGAVVGAAEAQCLHDEKNWQNREDFAVRSMAQTRATAKSLRMPLGFVMTLAGYEATPAEEMTFDRSAPAAPQRAASPAPAQRPPPALKASPTPKAATPAPVKGVNVKACRARFLSIIAKNRDFAWLLAVNKGWILDTEPLENTTDSYIPTTKEAFEAFTTELDGLMTDYDGKFPADKQAQYDAAYDDVPMDDPPVDVENLKLATDDSWRGFVIPFGKNAGKTLGSLPKNTCFGFYANFKVELEYKGRARKPEAIAKDTAFREALDQAGQFYEFTRPTDEVAS